MNAIAQAGKKQSVTAKATFQQDPQRCFPVLALNVKIHDRLARIAMSGCFDFKTWRTFNNCYMPLLDNTNVDDICVEMSNVDYIDSSALGMLMLLNERAKAVNKPVALLATRGVVSRVLETANFSKLFNIKRNRPENRALFG